MGIYMSFLWLSLPSFSFFPQKLLRSYPAFDRLFLAQGSLVADLTKAYIIYLIILHYITFLCTSSCLLPSKEERQASTDTSLLSVGNKQDEVRYPLVRPSDGCRRRRTRARGCLDCHRHCRQGLAVLRCKSSHPPPQCMTTANKLHSNRS